MGPAGLGQKLPFMLVPNPWGDSGKVDPPVTELLVTTEPADDSSSSVALFLSPLKSTQTHVLLPLPPAPLRSFGVPPGSPAQFQEGIWAAMDLLSF